MLTLSSLSLGVSLASIRGALRAARAHDWAAFAFLAAVALAAAAGSIPVVSMIVADGWAFRAVDLVLMLTFAGFSVYTLTILGDLYSEEFHSGDAERRASSSPVR